jgi:hypothetical protein
VATGTVNSKDAPLRKRSGPGTNFNVVGELADGTTVTITCQTTGTPEDGPFGRSTLWDRLADNSYVSDAYILTGTNNMVAPYCAGTGGTLQQRLDRFVSDWNEEFLNFDDNVANQCVSVAQAWAKMYLGLSDFTVASAVQIIGQAGSDFARVDYAPGAVPPPGAIVVWHECPAWSITSDGHVDVCVSGDANGFVGFDQNWGDDKHCRRVNHDFQGVSGWLIPKRVG